MARREENTRKGRSFMAKRNVRTGAADASGAIFSGRAGFDWLANPDVLSGARSTLPPMISRFLFCFFAAVSIAFAATKGPKPAHIAMGAEVAIADYMVAGKTMVFDFTSDYCPPCRVIAPKLDKLHAARADVAVVKVDINRPGVKGIDWKSPVAVQYGMRSIPHFKVYGPDGKLVAEGKAAWPLVQKMLN